MDRRSFIRNTGLASTALLMPGFLNAFDLKRINTNGKILVVIQWSGGNDGLNTFIPYQDDIYYKLRPSLAIEKNEILRLNDEMGVNPNLAGLKRLYDEGMVALFNNVGYPNPDRSHFRSMDIWQTGSSAEENWQTGWLGRALDNQCCDNKRIHQGMSIDNELHLALKGEQAMALATNNPKRLLKLIKTSGPEVAAEKIADEHVNYMFKLMRDTEASAEVLHEKSKIYSSPNIYPNNQFGKSLKTVAELICSDLDTTVYYVSLGGFDTHVFQKNKHNNLLKDYSDGVSSFVKDLKSKNKMKDVMVLTFSEFGRRVKQNASNGTDHGKASNMFVIGENMKKAGVYNEAPNLSDLDDGDIKHTIDFRQIYAEVLNKWMGADAQNILKGDFNQLNFIS